MTGLGVLTPALAAGLEVRAVVLTEDFFFGLFFDVAAGVRGVVVVARTTPANNEETTRSGK
jgi:hypothetical protein